jgi:hypothetical protein
MKKKLSLANIQGKLTRAEMKNIMAGSATCATCTTWVEEMGVICGPTSCTHAGVPSNCINCNGIAHCC